MSGAQSPYPTPNGHAHNGASYQPSDSLSVDGTTVTSDQDGRVSETGYGVAGPSSSGMNGYSNQ